ncbi:hypothetical protein MMC20_005191 [Loxospora ochrophaea]|nr:hypothetical protein [Loxospora ochrophaea]
MVQAPLDEVMSILQNGGIPLLRLNQDCLIASRAKYGMPYVAATYVWAGGLGNPKGNAMWLCQLQEISQLTSSSKRAIRHFEPIPKSPPAWFWVDTLSIPKVDETTVTKERGNNVWLKRVIAVDRMTQTYAAADSAIVLDPELRQIDLQWYQRATDPNGNEADQVLLESFSSILVSSWMTRCWTYQEGAMAKELLVKLRNHLFPMRLARSDTLRRNRRRLQRSEYSDIHDMLDEASAWFSRLPATRDDDAGVGRKQISEGDEGEPELFIRIWNDVAARSTSRTVDRLSILSLLVDLRPNEAQEKLPLALLFQPPLTTDERNEESVEFDKEEAAELDRGRSLPYHVEDPSYPLPRSLRSKPLPGQLGWMQRGGPEEDFIFFNNELLSAGYNVPHCFGFYHLA